ncbi:hypothetical protein [Winogradskyella sp. PE311]|uniref:hypothetical protein n=1 Tax=Winogradskyella sp. PE311 TaxID=3366943 RepID=UPI0039807C3A
MKNDFLLNGDDTMTRSINEIGISTLNALCLFIKYLPYGRNSNRLDLSLVWKERKGTCSSKHAFLKRVADLNNISVDLILGMYKMNYSNTPKIGDTLKTTNLKYIPEAHCYLKINNNRFDYTSSTSNFNRIKKDILLERQILPEQVSEFKVHFHKIYLRDWIKKNNILYSFEDIWKLREQCIKKLSN